MSLPDMRPFPSPLADGRIDRGGKIDPWDKTRMHWLKTTPVAFEGTWEGLKKHEVRVNDRDFKARDELWLFEWTPETGCTGRVIVTTVTWFTPGGRYGLPDDLCCMTIKVDRQWAEDSCTGAGKVIDDAQVG